MVEVNFQQRPEFDQVFMVDENILEKIVSFAGLKKTDTVLEIGAGPGNMTKMLAHKSKKVITVEIDERFKTILNKGFEKMKNVKIFWGNALDLIENEDIKFDKIVSNPPYSIAESLIKKLFGLKFKTAILTLPWKFVLRLAANPEENLYSKLSLFAQTFFRIETLMKVSADAWSPRPDTTSVVIRLTPKQSKSKKETILKELALQPDKKLKNALREALIKCDAKSGKKAGTRKITKRKAKNAIDDIDFPKNLLEKKISEMSLEEIQKTISRF